jgi:hypothetical protein
VDSTRGVVGGGDSKWAFSVGERLSGDIYAKSQKVVAGVGEEFEV